MQNKTLVFALILLVCLISNAYPVLDPPIFVKHNIHLDDHFILNDFYLYPTSEPYNTYFARITNIGPKDFESVK